MTGEVFVSAAKDGDPIRIEHALNDIARALETDDGLHAPIDRGEAARVLRVAIQTLAKTTTPWMTTEEAAEYVRCSVRTLEGYRRTGGGPFYHRQGGRVVVYHREDLDAWRRQGRASSTVQERLSGVQLAK